MRILNKLWQFLALSVLLLGLAHAQGGFVTLSEAQPTDSGKKVEVIEFFWYGCPHCYAFDPSLTEWVKKQGDNIVFKRVPANFRPSFEPQLRTYYALEAMGLVEKYHSKIFDAIHKDRIKLDTKEQLTDFLVKQGVDKAKFLENYDGFSMNAKVARATRLQSAYKLDGVPTIAINGRYVTSPAKMGETMPNAQEPALFQATLNLMSDLVAKSKK